MITLPNTHGETFATITSRLAPGIQIQYGRRYEVPMKEIALFRIAKGPLTLERKALIDHFLKHAEVGV